MTKIEKELQVAFEEAVKRVTETQINFAPDVKLKFYAYYKRALGNAYEINPIENSLSDSLIRGFKMNALFQVSKISVQEAMEKYIALADEYIP